MAACGGLEHIFEKPLPDNSTFLESLSPWKQIKSMKSVDDSSSFSELFGELHFKESHANEISSSPSSLSSNSSISSSNQCRINIPGVSSIHQEKNKNPISNYDPLRHKKHYNHSDSLSSMNSESLSMCTEGLGSESSDDVEDLLGNEDSVHEWRNQEERRSTTKNITENNNNWGESRRSRICRREIPPPISCIGRNGKPWVCFKSFREDGRFILKEVRIPTQEFLHACRENGRLRLRFVHSDDEILEEYEEPTKKQDNEGVKNRGENGESSQGPAASCR
ncbi:hypothetical protein F511_36943 [Dorcoceras hygrometricum]|uniref:FAF domain-containing protein n=1 Tax=Dorcoceras hygrometricum TaxID=472368 RepID=A0A2Z7AAE7_9LAMI|nr:hypothetical protein F511_36943 [Dorcoceras hygrometricum]